MQAPHLLAQQLHPCSHVASGVYTQQILLPALRCLGLGGFAKPYRHTQISEKINFIAAQMNVSYAP